jgi:hypothetical protein
MSGDGSTLQGEPESLFRMVNRYRDIAIHPDGGTFYIVTDDQSLTQDLDGLPTSELQNPGAILEFRYIGGH